MFQVKDKFQVEAEKKTKALMDKLANATAETIKKHPYSFDDICDCSDITEAELYALIDGQVEDMSVYDYFLLKAHLDSINHNTKDNVTQSQISEQLSPQEYANTEAECSCSEEENKKHCCHCKSKDKTTDMPNESLSDKVRSLYNEAVKEANIELFGSENDIHTLDKDALKYLVYKNKWGNHFDAETINDYSSLLRFLYHKLEERIKEKVYDRNNIAPRYIEPNVFNKELYNTINKFLKENG